ncbi:FAD-dependent oxidoreductase [Sphingomonas sp. MMS24-JH45]
MDRHAGRQIAVEADAGTITADRVIVAIPSSILAREGLTFHPALPDKHDAAAALPLGLADKAFVAIDRGEWPDNAHLIGRPATRCTGSYRLSPFGWPVIEAFLGGDCAAALEEGDACAFAIEELVALLGGDWRTRMRPLRATRWRHEAWIEGSYSHAIVGRAGDRAALAAPVDDRLFFAGEACSATDFSTAHGAYATGVAAAQAILSLCQD